MADKPVVTIYSDGGADPNPGPGGWGVVLLFDKHGEIITKELNGGEPHTTNNRMELTAAIQALRALKVPCLVEFHTDSIYLKKGITEWMAGWLETDFKKGKIENVDLWRDLNAAVSRHEIQWHWVKGHAGNRYNERADQLASAAMPRKQVETDAQVPRAYLRVSCVKGQGRWAALIRQPASGQAGEAGGEGDARDNLLTESLDDTTPNELDLRAAIAVLEACHEGHAVQLYTASSYLFNGIKKWVPGWKQNRWLKKDGKEVQHRGLWQALDALDQGRQVRWTLYTEDQPPAELAEVEPTLKQALKGS
jgi:ribonuclease HI